MLYDFNPAASSNFTFSPLLDGVSYTAELAWNIFAQRWYINIYTAQGELVVAKALVASPSQLSISSAVWDMGVVTITASAPHGLSIGMIARLLMRGNIPTDYNGWVNARVTGPSTFEFDLTGDPGQISSLGSFAAPVDLVWGYFATSSLIYWGERSQFETVP